MHVPSVYIFVTYCAKQYAIRRRRHKRAHQNNFHAPWHLIKWPMGLTWMSRSNKWLHGLGT